MNIDEKTHLSFAQINDVADLNNYLKLIGYKINSTNEPDWIKDVHILNDDALYANKKQIEEDITNLEIDLSKVNSDILENSKIKSCLYKKENELVEAVFPMLEKIFDKSLEGFVDIKEEDFNIEFEGLTLIGEIKGVSSNVKDRHIAQTENHRQTYIERTFGEGDYDDSTLFPVLIIDHQIDKPLSEREPINEKQVKYAKQHKVLVIETTTLIKLYEKSINKKMSKQELKQLLLDNWGGVLIL